MRLFNILQPRRAPDPIPPDARVELVGPDGPTLEEVYLQAATYYLSAQTSAYDQLDNRSGQMFSVASITLPITFTLINLAPDRVRIPDLAIYALWAAIGAYVALIVCIIQAGRYKTTEIGPSDVDIHKTGQDVELPGQVMQRWLADGYMNSAQINNATLASKSAWTARAQVALWAEGIALALAAIFTLSLGL